MSSDGVQQERLVQALGRIGEAILNATSRDVLLDELAEQVIQTGILRSLSISIVDERQGNIEVVRNLVRRGAPAVRPVDLDALESTVLQQREIGNRYRLDEPGILADVVRSGRMEAVDGWDEPRYDRQVSTPETRRGQTAYFIPVTRHGRVLAVLATGSFQTEREHVLERIRAMQPLVHQVGVALDHLRVVTELRREIERRREQQDRLQRSEQQLASIIKNVPDIIYRLDPNGRITFISDSVRRYGYDPADLQGRHVLEIVHPDDRERAAHRVDERRTGTRSTRSLEIRLLARGSQWPRSQVVPIQGDQAPVMLVNAEGLYSKSGPGVGDLLGTQGVARDISVRKRLERQLLQSEKLEALDLLATGIAHDFNNLLMAILTTTDYLVLCSDPEDPRLEDLDLIKQAGERAASLTRQIQAFCRRQPRCIEPVQVDALLRGLRPRLRRRVPSHVRMSVKCSADPGRVSADRCQLEQVVDHLVDNSCEAMGDGGRLDVAADPVEVDSHMADAHPGLGPGSYVRLAVSDNGSGMDAATAAHAFDPFFTTKEVGRGTGMGLAVVFGIVKQNSGHVMIHSAPGKGTSVEVYLPATTAPPPGDAVPATPVSRGALILLVEDDDMLRRQVRRMLASMGYQVHSARSGQEALELAERLGHVDLLLTDVVMPGMSGRSLAASLRQQLPGLRAIFMSGYDQTAPGAGAPDGADDVFMAKPFASKALGDAVRKTLAG